MDTSVFEKYESKVRSYCRKYPVVFKAAKDSYITDEDGNRYLDFFCGAGALDYGHNNEYIKQKVIDYIAGDGITHALDMYTTAKRDFLEYFEEEVIRPRGLDYVVQFPGPTGTNANEAALKLARKVTGRPNVFALMGAFHGMTLGTLACTSESYARGGAGIAMNGVTHIPAPYMFPELDTVEYMERLITDDHSGVELPAAIILETVQAEGGIYVLDEQYLRNVRDLCDRYGILLIADEVQVGCGRTGDFFSFQRAGIKPDMVSMSKSIGGYGMPFAVTLFRPELDIWGPGEHNGTFRGNQPAIVAAKAGLELMLREHTEKRAKELGAKAKAYLEEELPKIDPRFEVRGIGLIMGIDFAKIDAKLAHDAILECFRNGLIVEGCGRKDSVLKIMPSLLVTEEDLKKGLDIILRSVKKVLG